MSSIVDVRTRIAAALSAGLPGVNVSTHGGDFALDDLLRYGAKPPHAVLACLRFRPRDDHGGLVVAEVTWGLVVLTKDATITTPAPRTVRRDESVLDLADRTARIILRLFPGIEDTSVGRPQEMICSNEYSDKLDRNGIAMWGIQFGQVIDLQEENDSSVPFERVHADWDLLPLSQPGDELGDQLEAQDIIELEQDP